MGPRPGNDSKVPGATLRRNAPADGEVPPHVTAPSTPVHLLGISGSLRRGSYNTALLRAMRDLLPNDVTMDVTALAGLPMYDWDLEQAAGFPPAVQRLRDQVARADGIVFGTPEYNFSVTGALKNAIDWLSRGPDSPLDRKPAAIVGVGGGSGTARSQAHLRQILGHNRLRVVATPQVLVTRGTERFAEGRLVDPDVAANLTAVAARLVEIIERERRDPAPQVDGNILVVTPRRAAADRIARHLAERGHRSIIVDDATDAIDLLPARRIGAIVVDPGLPSTGRADLRSAAADLPFVETVEPRRILDALDATFRSHVTGV